jgi:RNA-directed DNA polymerase
MEAMKQEETVPSVPLLSGQPLKSRDKQGTETRAAREAKWSWVEPAAWSSRMLTALEKGVKGDQWFSLIDKVWRKPNLEASWKAVKANCGAAGIDRQSVKDFSRHAEEEIAKLQRELQQCSYQPKAVRRVYIEKTGSKEQRPLGIPAVRDRVVQGAVRHVLEPIFENVFAEHSYGFRPGKGAKDALRRVDGLMRGGKTWTVDADLKGYFDSIPHDQLLERVREYVADGRVVGLLEKFLEAGVMGEDGELEPASETGTPQGAVLSPLMANLYLNELDHLMAGSGYEMTRYADDFVIQCESEAQAHMALEQIKDWVKANGLELHPEKTRITDAGQTGAGFDFLGYHFVKHKGKWRRWPRKKSEKKMRAALRERTPRTSGQSMEAIIKELNVLLRGWFEYFKHSHWTAMGSMDRYLRGRLRSILRKRIKLKGRGRGKDHQRWPNAYFDELGLFCLSAAWEQLRQSR